MTRPQQFFFKGKKVFFFSFRDERRRNKKNRNKKENNKTGGGVVVCAWFSYSPLMTLLINRAAYHGTSEARFFLVPPVHPLPILFFFLDKLDDVCVCVLLCAAFVCVGGGEGDSLD